MEKDDVIRLIAEWQNRILRIQGIYREYLDALHATIGSKPIKIITGFRRSGKSFLVQLAARKLIENNTFSVSNILYLNFEDFRLAGINTPEKVDAFYKVFRSEIADGKKKLLIFDEIQNVNNWDRFIRTIYETDHDVEIILTGSNSRLLSSEIGSNLAGRFIELSIQPFDFTEYLRYMDVKISNAADYFRNQEKIHYHFSQYVKFGGLPEILSINSETARFSYIEGIISKVILDDIIKRFNIKHTSVVEKTLFYLFSAIGNIISFTKISNYLKRLDISIKNETLIKYIQYMLTTFAIYETNKLDWKLGKLFGTTRKYYAVDTGVVNLYPGMVSNYSKQLENIVFLKLKRNRKQINFGALPSGKEIDFITQTANGEFEKYQVTQTLHKDNYDRELSSFILQNTYLKDGKNILLTLDENEEEIDYQDAKVLKKNLIRWLLGL
ncbi:MAG: ATP-binding protein [Desulfobacterales bacterium]|nr:ATP-binding protein [Desulfobacterales bacterium]